MPDKVNRTRYDLSHYSFVVGNIGLLQTLSIIPVIAGDSIEITHGGVWRLSPLRQPLTLDARVETFFFFVPHRHVYGSDWTDFIKQGTDESVSLGTRTLTSATECFGTKTTAGQVVPLWLTQGYLNIWNRYFKHPNDADFAANHFDAITATDVRIAYGLTCGFPPRVWNVNVDAQVTTADTRFALTDTNTTVDLNDMAIAKGRLKSERRREFYAQRYNEIMYAQWGANVNTDADQRPELLLHNRGSISGMDIMGTDDATLGSYVGVAKSLNVSHMPRKYFSEHGVIWCMALIRFDPVAALEINFLARQSNPSYATIAGDPEIVSRQPPRAIDLQEWILGSPNSNAGLHPYGQWYREHENRVHEKFRSVAGHPFVDDTFSTVAKLRYITDTFYTPMFSSVQMAQWQCYGRFNVVADRVIPEVSTSIFSGTN